MAARNITLAASAARTATGQGTAVKDVNRSGDAAAYLYVSAASGTTPTLDVTIEEYDPLSGQWFTVGTFAQKTTTGQERIELATLPGTQLRAVWTIGGTTPSFTFSVGLNIKD